MDRKRALELSLAAAIGCGAWFAAMVPGASPSEVHLTDSAPASWAPTPRLNPATRPMPRLDLADFRGLELETSSRAVANAVLARRSSASAFAADPRQTAQIQGALTSSIQVRGLAENASGDRFDRTAVGVQIKAPANAGSPKPRWWIVGGAGRSSYAVAPGGLREYTVAPVSAESTVGDAHFGIGVELGESAFASVGYVREVRKYSLGVEDWEEDDHFLGVSVQARW